MGQSINPYVFMKTAKLLFFLLLPLARWPGRALPSDSVLVLDGPSESIRGRMARVENGLTTDIMIPEGSSIKEMDLRSRMKSHKVNGVSIAVINDGKVEWARGYGMADAGSHEPVTTRTLFQSASIGKTITALAVLKLVKEGRIGLDDDVNTKLISWKVPENKFTKQEKVTLRRLLSHSAGFTDDYGFGGYPPGSSVPDLLQMLNAQPPANHKKSLVVGAVPGTVTRYSGGGYLIVQQLVEDLTGMSFQAWVEREIFGKLNLAESTYGFFPDQQEGKSVARGHYGNGRIDKKKKYHVYPEAAAAGFWSTPADLALILLQMQREAKGQSDLILNQTLMEKMLSAQTETSSRGLGVVLAGAMRAEGFGHSGSNAGYQCLMYASATTAQGAVIMTNSDNGIGLAQEIMRSIANEYNWPFMQTQTFIKLAGDKKMKFNGQFRSSKGMIATVMETKDGLSVTSGRPKETTNLYPIAENLFIIREAPDNWRFSFVPDSSGNVTGLDIYRNAGTKVFLEKVR